MTTSALAPQAVISGVRAMISPTTISDVRVILGIDFSRLNPLGDGTFSITQFGSTRSINASAAAAIAMHTWVRQHADLTGDHPWRG